MIHFITWLPHPYQQTLFRVLNERYGRQLLVWFGEARHEEFPFRSNTVEGFSSRYLDSEGYWQLFSSLRSDKEAVVILGGWGTPMSVRTLMSTTLLRVPVLIWADHPHPRKRSRTARLLRGLSLRLLSKVVHGFLACGQPTLDHLVSLGIPREKISVFPYWTDIQSEWTRPKEISSNSGSEYPSLKLISVGRLVPVKRFEVAIEALSLANKKADYRIAELVLVGDGPERDSLERLTQAHGCSDSVTLPGWLESQELQREIDSADVLIITSSFEPYGVVVLEAMAAGRPVLASEGIIAAVDRDEGTGAVLFHGVGDARCLAEQITGFAADRKRLYDASMAARRTAEKWPPSRALEILSEALGRTKAGRRLIARQEVRRSPEKLTLPDSTGAVQ